MKELSNSLLGMTAVIKDTATLTVWHFGKGMAEPVKRIMFDIIGLTDETGGAFEEFQKRLERAGERVGRKFEQMYKGAKRFFRELTSMPGWNKMTWSEKVTLALDKILESVTAWLKGPGGEAIKETGEILGRLLAAGLEGAQPHIIPVAVELGKTLGGAVVQGIYEAIKANPWAGILLGAYVGFRIAGPKGAAIGAGIGAATWGLPKGFEALGKHIPGSGHYTRERLAEYERAEQMFEELKAVTPPGEPLFPGTELRAMPKRAIGGIFSRPHTALVAEAGPEAIIPLSTQMRARALALYEETGRRLGVGNWLGTPSFNSVPLLAGTGGYGGNISISTGPITAQFNITTSSNPDDVINAIRGKYEDLVDKWTAMSEVWENTKEILNSTIFSSEWWLEKWGNVESWTSEKWDKMKTVWETVKSNISSTLFSKTWWESKWENVKTWASGVLDDITARWESIKESFQAGREAGQAAAAHAAGGIFSSPHLGMVAEAGPEAIIPLSSKMRDRGIELWKQAGRFLGITPHAEGGIFGSSKLVTEAGPEAGIPFSRSPERIRERGLGLWQQINNVFSPAMPALALAGSGAETGLLYDGIDYGPELSGQVQELNVPISIANITANISGSSLDVEDIAEQVGEQVKQQVKWEITRELANAIENRI